MAKRTSLLERAQQAASAARRRYEESPEGAVEAAPPQPVRRIEIAPPAPVDDRPPERTRRLASPGLVVAVLLVVKLEVFRIFVWGPPKPLMVLADLAAVAVVVGLIGLLAGRRASTPVFWIANLAITALLLSSVMYAKYYGTVPIYRALDELDQAAGVQSSITDVFRARYLLLGLDLVLAPLVWLLLRTTGFRPRPPLGILRRLRRFGLISLTGLIASVVFAASNAGVRNELQLAESLGLLGYQAHALAEGLIPDTQTIGTDDVYDAVTRLREDRDGPRPRGARPAHFGAGKGKNLIVVQLEAMQTVVLGLEVDGQAVTPFLNELVGYSQYFPRHFQQVGKGMTADAEFMSNTSIYPRGDVAMSSTYGDRAIPSLPKLLREQGYVSETFHVNTLEFWDRDLLYPAIGFDKWHAKPEFEDDHFNQFGASDESLFATGLERIGQLAKGRKPFYAQFISASGHGPFDMPADKERLRLPAELAGTAVGKYLQTQSYTDHALGRFVDGLKRQGVWDDTVFVVYGDHFGLWEESTVAPIRKLGADYHWEDRITTPLLMYVPGMSGKESENVASQLDIMPTIANLMGVSLENERFVHFGVDLLNTSGHAFGERFFAPTGTFINDDVWFVPGNGFEDGTAVSVGDWQVTDPTPHAKDYDHVLELMRLSDAYVESLPRRTDP